MPDQDEFDPVGRDWKRAYALCASGGDLEEAGDEVLRAVTRMIRRCGGCPSFREIEALLKDFWHGIEDANTRSRDSLSSDWLQFDACLGRLYKGACDNRIDMIALRTARVMAHEMAEELSVLERRAEIGFRLGILLVQNIICHRALDVARAHGVGIAFRTPTAAHAYHDELLSRIHEHIRKIGTQLTVDPSGQSVRRLRVLPQSETSAMLFDDKRFRFDFDDGPSGK